MIGLPKPMSPYSTKVAGVISTDPGMVIGSVSEDYGVAVALLGRTPVKITTENGPIQKGDLITTSSTPGYAMKFELLEFTGDESIQELVGKLNENEKRRNSIIGKALEPFADSDQGKIEVLLMLQ